MTDVIPAGQPLMSDMAINIQDIHVATQTHGTQALRSLDILQAAVRSPRGWVWISPIHIIAPRRIQQFEDSTETVGILHPAVIEKQD